MGRYWVLQLVAFGVLLGCLVGWSIGVDPAIPVGVGLSGVAVISVPMAIKGWQHRRLALALSSRCAPAQVQGFDLHAGRLAGAAFVAGLCRPQIYCDRRLLEELSPAELTAVLLHEHAHRQSRDPMRRVAADGMALLIRRFPAGRRLLTNITAGMEIQADRYALDNGASRPALASALLKVAPMRAYGVGFASAADLRLRALLEEDSGCEYRHQPARHIRRAALITLPAALACIVLTFEHAAIPALATCCA